MCYLCIHPARTNRRLGLNVHLPGLLDQDRLARVAAPVPSLGADIALVRRDRRRRGRLGARGLRGARNARQLNVAAAAAAVLAAVLRRRRRRELAAAAPALGPRVLGRGVDGEHGARLEAVEERLQVRHARRHDAQALHRLRQDGRQEHVERGVGLVEEAVKDDHVRDDGGRDSGVRC